MSKKVSDIVPIEELVAKFTAELQSIIVEIAAKNALTDEKWFAAAEVLSKAKNAGVKGTVHFGQLCKILGRGGYSNGTRLVKTYESKAVAKLRSSGRFCPLDGWSFWDEIRLLAKEGDEGMRKLNRAYPGEGPHLASRDDIKALRSIKKKATRTRVFEIDGPPPTTPRVLKALARLRDEAVRELPEYDVKTDGNVTTYLEEHPECLEAETRTISSRSAASRETSETSGNLIPA